MRGEPAQARDDAGSALVMAAVTMMVLSSLALAGLARTLSLMTQVRHGQSADSALAAADAGLNDALYRLDHGMPDEAGWTLDGLSGSGTYRYRATRLSVTEYKVESRGTVGGTNHALRAVVARGPGYALFANDELRIGNSTSGVLGLSASSWLTIGGADTNQVHVGSNTGVYVAPGGDAGDFQDTHGAGTRCSGCAHWVQHARPYPMPDVQSPTGLTQACPVAGTFTGVVNGAGGKPYVCSRDVAITGVVTVVNGPFILYVLPTTALSGAKQEHSLDLRTAVINASGSASNVQIYKSGAAALSLDTSVTPGQVTFSGLLYAPQSALDLQASKWWTGSVIVKAVNVTGAPVLTLGYDLDLQRLVNDWAVTHYAEVPASEVGL